MPADIEAAVLPQAPRRRILTFTETLELIAANDPRVSRRPALVVVCSVRSYIRVLHFVLRFDDKDVNVFFSCTYAW